MLHPFCMLVCFCRKGLFSREMLCLCSMAAMVAIGAGISGNRHLLFFRNAFAAEGMQKPACCLLVYSAVSRDKAKNQSYFPCGCNEFLFHTW